MIKDYSSYQFHASALADLVGGAVSQLTKPALTEAQNAKYNEYMERSNGNGRALTENQKSELLTFQEKLDKKNSGEFDLPTETLLDLWIKESLDVVEFQGSKATRRGDRDEMASLELINTSLKTEFRKNLDSFQNDYLVGTPDVLTNDHILDIKTKQTMKGFVSANQKDADSYKWQLWAYSQLTGLKQAKIAFCLPSYPDYVILNEICYSLYLAESDRNALGIHTTKDLFLHFERLDEKFGGQRLQKAKEIYQSKNFDRFSPQARVKVFDVELPQIDPQIVYNILNAYRAYLNGISRNNELFFT